MSDEPKIERKSLIIKWDPPGWYNDAWFGLRLLYGYIESVERQIDEAIERFRNEKQTEVIKYDDGWADIITFHHGIHDGDYHLESVFEKYFPYLQRRSALITLYSFFELQLDDLCKRYARERGFVLQASDLGGGDGIKRLSVYLKKMAGLPLDDKSMILKEIRKIRGIRNAFVHNDGKLKENNREVITYALYHGLLENGEWVKVTAEFLPHVIKTFDSYFKEIDSLIPR